MNKIARKICARISRALKENGKKANQKLVKKSFALCLQYHKGQKRESGKPYWTHPAAVAVSLADLGADAETVAAALLHDTLEDTKATEKVLIKQVGSEVTELVKGVTKLDRISKKGRQHSYESANFQKIMLATAKDLRVMAIKLLDKRHNMETLHYLPKKDRIRIASQCLTVFVPLAHKLGLHALTHELEDKGFAYVNAKKFGQLKTRLQRQQAKKMLEGKAMVRILKKKMKEKKLKGELDLYKRTVFSTYAKVNRIGKVLEDLYASVILRIKMPTVEDCYKGLGLVHNTFFPVPNKLKDYIAIPLPNLYQALHTTVIGPKGQPFKVYIATEHMFDIRKRGILALDLASPGKESGVLRDRLKELHTLFKLPEYFKATGEFMRVLTKESLSKTLFVFTPKGNMIELPYGATPLDFAFKISPWLGQHVWRAKVDGKFVAFDTRLQNGNIIEIIPAMRIQVRKQWLELANAITTKRAIQRLLEKRDAQQTRPLDIFVVAKDRIGLMSEASHIFETEKVNIDAGLSLSQPNKMGLMQFNVPTLSKRKLKKITKRLRAIKGIKQVSVERL